MLLDIWLLGLNWLQRRRESAELSFVFGDRGSRRDILRLAGVHRQYARQARCGRVYPD